MTNPLCIDQIRVYEYVMPMKRGFGTARGVVNQARNIVISLEGHHGETDVAGVGEAAPRSARLTGDTMEGSWAFLLEAAKSLEGAEIPLGSYEESLDGIRSIMADLGRLAIKLAPEENPTKPYRGILSGIDMALLDFTARAHGVTTSVLLGQHRKRIGVTAATISSARDRATVEERTRKHAHRFPISRVKGKGNLETDLDLMQLVADANKAEGLDKPLWVDVNEGMKPAEAFEFIDKIVALMKARKLPSRVIVEQPVSKAHGHVLPELQRRADRKLRSLLGRRRTLTLSVMADESLWDAEDLEKLLANGGCAAINIKIQKVGGLLAGLDLAKTALERKPDIELYIGGMLATSDVTSWALKNLAMAMPKLDYYTAVPPGNVAGRIAKPYMKYRSSTSHLLPAQKGKGHGVSLVMEDLGQFITRAARFPAPSIETPTVAGEVPNEFSEPYLLKFKKLGLDSHLLEREALRRGLETVRIAPLIFSARHPESQDKIGFYWTASDETSRVASYVTGNKQVTRNLLLRAGVPVPQGRQFTLEQRDKALAYAADLGWPLVVKPQAGTGGQGVTTGITSVDEVGSAIDFVAKTKYSDFVVERHVEGRAYRFIVLGDEVLSVFLRRSANVVGDGVSSIAELISAKNLVRATRQQLQARPLKLNDRARFQLERQGLSWDSVPEAGQFVVVSTAESITQGGDSFQVIGETHPSLIEAAIKAVAVVPGMRFAGVDFLISDHRLPVDEQDVGICEINSSPATSSHHFPLYGPARNVSEALILDRCEQAGIPLTDPAETLDLSVEVRGTVQDVGYRHWMRTIAEQFGISGWVRNGDSREVVEARLAGAAEPVAALASMAIAGSADARPQSVQTTHVHGSGTPDAGFVIRS
jgi:D-alanine-D-alanine ligase-like ATP-grasp enzyme/L-alanine-DL-glutamate epimerase-like enolase superfamily enzyme/acylphosphatase